MFVDMYKYFLCILFLLLPMVASAQYDFFSKPRYFSAEVQYGSYSDIVRNDNNPTDDLNASYGINVAGRFYRIFSLVASYGRSVESDWNYMGLGLRIDLPGFFFFGGNANHFVRSKKLRGINTHITVSKFSVNQQNEEDFINDKYAFGADLFVAGDVYLNLEVGILSHQGNQFLAPAIGLGYEF